MSGVRRSCSLSSDFDPKRRLVVGDEALTLAILTITQKFLTCSNRSSP